MIRAIQFICRGHYAMQAMPGSSTWVSHALDGKLPSSRLHTIEGFSRAYRLGSGPAVDAFWRSFRNVQSALGARYVENRRSKLVVAHGFISFSVATVLSIAVLIYTGVNACMAAAYLNRSGRPDLARERLRQNAFEVCWTMRIFEVACATAVSAMAIRTVCRLNRMIR